MKNTLKPLPSFEVDTPRTDEVRHNVAELAMLARKLERELNELKAIHKTAITDCQQYTPERWKEICDLQEPAAVWLDGKQMTELMKNHNTSAQCHTENGEVFMTDQSGNGHHLKRNKMKKLSETPKAYITIDREETILFADILKAAPTPPTTEFKRALRAYRDFIIKHKQ